MQFIAACLGLFTDILDNLLELPVFSQLLYALPFFTALSVWFKLRAAAGGER